jgi:hypothetical protein
VLLSKAIQDQNLWTLKLETWSLLGVKGVAKLQQKKNTFVLGEGITGNYKKITSQTL